MSNEQLGQPMQAASKRLEEARLIVNCQLLIVN